MKAKTKALKGEKAAKMTENSMPGKGGSVYWNRMKKEEK